MTSKNVGGGQKILVVDDEHMSDLMRSVLRRLETDGFRPIVVAPEGEHITGDDYEAQALFAMETERPSAVLLDVRFGEYDSDRFKGLSILKKIVERDSSMPVLMFTQYTQGPYRDTAVNASLTVSASVDFIDKLASPEEVVLRLRRLIGSSPDTIKIGELFEVDAENAAVYVVENGRRELIREIQGMKLEILNELASAMFRSEGELVPFSRLERFSDGEDSRASLRVRIRELKVSLGRAVSREFGANELIINVRNRGYRLVDPDH
ncbi:response regulator transcription factor [Dehalococcoides mccartyi]|nr:response regulator transcription factor [Dehalococcoides mccartyi]